MKKLFLIGALLVMATGLSQTQGKIKGNILDNEMQNEPLLFANVELKGADKKTETNFHGNFEFNNLETGKYTLVVSYAGYETMEIPVEVLANNVTRVKEGLKAKTIDLNAILGLSSSNDRTSESVSEQSLK